MRFAVGLAVLFLAARVAAAAPGRTPSGCAVAWNQWAPPALRTAVAHSRARAAFIAAHASVGIDTLSKSGATTSTTSDGCAIDFVLPGGGVLTAWGAWRSGRVRVWHQPLLRGRAMPVPHNARVHADGTVGFTG